jgi:Hemerythrin HHE cation binding domain
MLQPISFLRKPGHADTTMRDKLFQYFEKDHRRLEGLLNRATKELRRIDLNDYAEFRSGLLRHIGMEEKILFPAAQKANGGVALSSFARLKLDHGALTALMVPPPTATIITAIRSIIQTHDELEESAGGPYETCEMLNLRNIDALLAEVEKAPAVPVHAHRSEPFVLEATKRAVERAGYRLEDYA